MTTEPSALTKAKEELDRQAQSAMESARAHALYLDDKYKTLIGATKFYESTSVALVTQEIASAINRAGLKAKAYYKALAAEMKRHLLYAETSTANTYDRGRYLTHAVVSLTISKKRRLENIVAGLLLLATKCASEHDARMSLSPVSTVDQSSAFWSFFFVGEEGRKIFDGFVEQCRTDPVFKIVIGM
jgi:hypothetical protein